MSIIFGTVRGPGAPLTESEVSSMGDAANRYATEGTHVLVSGRAGMGFQANRTHERSKLDSQPVSDANRNMIVFDGRLDNYRDLSDELRLECEDTSDARIVLAAFQRWDDACFSRLVGDWAIALWSERHGALYLARDHAGTRTLYFSETKGAISFSTYVETLVAETKDLDLDEAYAVLYLSGLPTGDLTPYKGIKSVTPAHVLRFRDGHKYRSAHWSATPTEEIRYSNDLRYEEQFLELFARSVDRRTGPGAPILAHLSGGMDSSSIVCMSDLLRTRQRATSGLLDTISYYDDTEPHWDERPYFTLIEAARGKAGVHVDVSNRQRSFDLLAKSDGAYSFPGGDTSALRAEQELMAVTRRGGHKVVLSGIGGDELLGGVPTLDLQMADLAVTGKGRELWELALASCLLTRRPLATLFLELLHSMWRLYTVRGGAPRRRTLPWLSSRASRILRASVPLIHPDQRLLRAKPHVIATGNAWWLLLETMPHLTPGYFARYEYRYPYLDRDLVDFLLRIPKDQLVRPGRRRSLMRRALVGIVPSEVLERRRKGYLSRSPVLSLVANKDRIEVAFERSKLAKRGVLNLSVFKRHLESISGQGDVEWIPTLARAAHLETFVRSTFPEAEEAVGVAFRGARSAL